MSQVVTSILRRKRYLRADCVEFWLTVPPEILNECAPGRFIHVDCGPGFTLRRPLGLSGVWEDCVGIVFAVRGEGTARLADTPVGGTVNFLGPLGRGYDLSTPRRRLLIGGGLGTPPVLYAAMTLSQAGCKADALLAFGNANLAVLTSEMASFCGRLTLASDDGSLGIQARADQAAASLLDQYHYEEVIACGPTVMLKSLALLTAQRGIPCQVSMEEHMACGVGACLVCACEMADGTVSRVCRDGPVYASDTIQWSTDR